MSGEKEIRDRIKTIQNTQKITNAMYLISTTKMRKARNEYEKTKPFFEALNHEFSRMLRRVDNVDSEYFYSDEEKSGEKGAERNKCAIFVMTADKGLAGSYNSNVIKETEKLMKRYKKTYLFVMGEYGRTYFKKHNIPIVEDYNYPAMNPTLHIARKTASALLTGYDKGLYKDVYIIYTNLSGITEVVERKRILPLNRRRFLEKNVNDDKKYEDYEFYPSFTDVIDNVVPMYLAGFLYGAMIDSFCSEQNARMTAMSSANENAEEIMSELSVEYNRVRQAAITQEITEVAAGAKALRRKKKRSGEAVS
ncbi:MAG: ATP synthase F1 subunit gamma [Eubacterium sp.]|nr:ATP synthase F1 subunit gamma [Eubacterium sp.]